MLCNADDAMIRILVTVTSGMLQPFPLKEISSPRFKALGYVMENEICQNSFIFNFLIKQEAGALGYVMEKEICQNSFIFNFLIKQEAGENHSTINIYVHKVHGFGYSFPSLEYTPYLSAVVLKRSVEFKKILQQIIFRFPGGFLFRVLAPLYLVPLGSRSSSNLFL